MNETDGIKHKDDKHKHELIIENDAVDSLYIKLPELKYQVSKVVREARQNNLMCHEIAEISTYHEMNIWIRNHYRLFYSVFQTDLLSILASIPKS